jgi:hypothetical protein
MYTIQKKRWTKVPHLLLILISCLSGFAFSACAGLVITTWIIDGQRGILVRKDGHGNIVDKKELRDADNYRCYSRSDDEAWRTSYAACRASCSGK